MNILILSVGTRNKIVQYFKNEVQDDGLVIATDASELAPALYDADKYYVVPRITEDNYLETIFTICKENNVKAVLSLIDPELSLLAEHRQAFLDIGVTPIISNYNSIELCFDKYEMYKFLSQNRIPTVNTYLDKEKFYSDVEKNKIDYPVFVKPVRGSASLNINKVYEKEEIELLFEQYDNLIIQEFMDGQEFGADCYIDMISNETVAAFTKEKLLMRAGETDKSISVKDEKLFEIIKKTIDAIGFKGIIDIDIFKIDGKYYISEVNPRFGGGYPHGYEVGVNIPKMIVENIKGNKNQEQIEEFKENTYMMKYNELKIQGN